MLRFLSHLFKIVTLHTSFDQENKMSPFFRFNLQGSVRKYAIQIDGMGTLNDYKVQLQSEPPLTETDIVSLLTLGIVSDQFQGSDAIEFTSLEAASFLFGQFQEKLAQASQQNFGVQFRLSSSFSDTKNAVRPRIFLSKGLSDNVDLHFSSTLDKETIFEDKILNLEWQLNKRFSVIGLWEDTGQDNQNTESAVGFDIKYKYEFE